MKVIPVGVAVVHWVVMIAFLAMTALYLLPVRVHPPDWLVRDRTSTHYRRGVKEGRGQNYRDAVQQFRLAMEEEPALAVDCRLSIAACDERIAESIQPRRWSDPSEVAETLRIRNGFYAQSLDAYALVLRDRPGHPAALRNRAQLLMRRG